MKRKKVKQKPNKSKEKKQNEPLEKSIEQKFIEVFENRRSNYHNFYITEKLGRSKLLGAILFFLISLILLCIYIFIVFKIKNFINLNLILFSSCIVFCVFFTSVFLIKRYKIALECFDEDIIKDDNWVYERGRIEFVSRALIFFTSAISIYSIYLLTNRIEVLVLNFALAISYLLKFIHSIFVLWMAKKPVSLFSSQSVAFSDSLLYVGTIWFLIGLIFPILIYFFKPEPSKVEYFMGYGIYVVLLYLIFETRKRIRMIRSEKILLKTHIDVLYFVKPNSLFYALADEYEQFRMKMTDYGRLPIPKDEIDRKFADKREKEISGKLPILAKILLTFIILVINVYITETIKNFQFGDFIKPIVAEHFKELNTIGVFISTSIIVLIGLLVIRKLNIINK